MQLINNPDWKCKKLHHKDGIFYILWYIAIGDDIHGNKKRGTNLFFTDADKLKNKMLKELK